MKRLKQFIKQQRECDNMINNFFSWVDNNFNYKLIFCPYDRRIYCCKKKYQYALLNYTDFIKIINVEKNDWYNTESFSNYAKQVFPEANKEICKYALKKHKKEIEKFKKRIKESVNK